MMMDVNNLINKLPYAVQNAYGAIATVVAANVIIAELAGRIARSVCDTFHKRWNLSGKTLATVMVTVMFASVAGMNFALNKLLKFPFDLRITVGLSSLTALTYTIIRVAKAKDGKVFE